MPELIQVMVKGMPRQLLYSVDADNIMHIDTCIAFPTREESESDTLECLKAVVQLLKEEN